MPTRRPEPPVPTIGQLCAQTATLGAGVLQKSRLPPLPANAARAVRHPVWHRRIKRRAEAEFRVLEMRRPRCQLADSERARLDRWVRDVPG
jgi:hypothetical protein